MTALDPLTELLNVTAHRCCAWACASRCCAATSWNWAERGAGLTPNACVVAAARVKGPAGGAAAGGGGVAGGGCAIAAPPLMPRSATTAATPTPPACHRPRLLTGCPFQR